MSVTQVSPVPGIGTRRMPLSAAMVGRSALDLALGILLVLSVATLFASEAWLPDMLSFFRPQLFFVSVAVLLATLVDRWPSRMLLAGALVAFNLWPLMVRAAPIPQEVSATERTIRVMSMNLLYQNTRVDRMRQVAGQVAPDILVFQEAGFHWPADIAALDGLPYRTLNLSRPSGDVEIFSRFPLTVTLRRDLALPKGDMRLFGHPIVRAVVDPGEEGHPFVLYAIHPPTPRSAEAWRARTGYLEAIADLIRGEPEGMPVMVVGDWNTPPWSPAFKRFVEATGIAPTDALPWPAGTRRFNVLGLTLPGWLGTPIDRLALSSKIALAGFHVAPSMGSDHLPVYADVAVR